jgi:rubrerythrin
VKTNDNLQSAFSAKARDSIKYSSFANAAEREGLIQPAKFFRALAEAEKISALNLLALIVETTDTEQNISSGIDSETYEFTQMYPTFIAQAESDGDARASIALKGAMAADRTHGNLLSEMLENYKKDREFSYYVCTFCGNITERYAPEKCPICNSSKEKYKAVE